ncbi:MAG: proton-conducting transporter membrane subunit [Bacillota bacterium]
MSFEQHFPALIVAILFGIAFLSPILHRWARVISAPALIAALFITLIMAVSLLIQVYQGGEFTYHMGGWPPPYGVEFKVDYIRAYMLLIVLAVSFWIMVYALKDLVYELKSEIMGWYYSLYALLVGSMTGIALTNDLFNLFVLIEICAISACAIISIKEDRACFEASFKYLILSAMGTGCFLLGVAMLYMVTGQLNYDLINQSLPAAVEQYPNNIFAASALFVVAFGTKAALFPLHVWLPDAHASAPSPSSAMLSGVVIKIYAFALFIIFYQLFPRPLLDSIPLNEIVLWLSTAGILFGSIFAMVQIDLKRMLAYSSIGQIGYIFLGIGLDDPIALTGGFYHLLVHAITKSMLFMVAGVIIYSTGIRQIKQLAGVGQVLPLTMFAFTIGAASMIGIPGTGGLISKWYLALGALEAGRLFFVVIILASSLLNAVYYMPIIVNAFMHQGAFEHLAKPVPRQMLIPLVIGIMAVIFFGVIPGPALTLLENALAFLF